MYVTSLLLCGLLAQIPPASQLPVAPAVSPPQDVAPADDEPPPPFNAAETAPPAAVAPARGQTPAEAAPSRPQEESTHGGSDAPSGNPTVDNGPPSKNSVPADSRASRYSPLEILVGGLTMHEGEQPRGRPLPLVDVLRSVPDRTSQLRATESYWRLAEAVADYNFSWDEYQQLERLKPARDPNAQPTPDERMLATRLQAAKARMQDADVALVAAQYDLAGAIHLPTGQPLPLPADVPHVGAYRTVMDQLYAGRAIPVRAVLIDRTLPVRRSALEARAAAVHAATDALVAAEEAHFEGRCDLALVMALVDDLGRQRRAFLADVRVYNSEIAEYAMSAPTPALDPHDLASMLIKPAAGANPPSTIAGGTGANPAVPSGVERAGFTQPLPPSTTSPLQPVPEGQLQLGPPPGYPPAPRNEPTLAPPRPTTEGSPRDKPKTQLPRDEDKSPIGSASIAPPVAGNDQYVARKPRFGGDTAGAPHESQLFASPCLYPALSTMTAGDQARQLATVLCWEPAASADISPQALSDFLTNISAEHRRDAITAYWQAQLAGARAQALEQQLEQFEALGAVLANSALEGPAAHAPSSMLLVRAAKIAAQADARRAEADRLAAQWALTIAAGRPLTGPWLAAQTPPHAGGYRLQLNELSRELLESAVVQRLSATIPQLRAAVTDRAAAVIAADQARGNMALAPDLSLAATDRALSAIREQAAETTAFLTRLTDYNIEIATYANAVLPPATNSQTLARALVSSLPASGR